MIRLYIIFLALLIKASFSKVQGDYFEYGFFPFSNLKMIWPEYAWHITFYICMIALSWDYYLQEQNFKFEMLIFAILMTGELLDFLLRCNMSWFMVGNYPFSYDGFMFLVFGSTVIRSQWKSSI